VQDDRMQDTGCRGRSVGGMGTVDRNDEVDFVAPAAEAEGQLTREVSDAPAHGVIFAGHDSDSHGESDYSRARA